MASSDFWQDLAEQFRSINNAWSIRADWDNTAGEMGFGYWVLTGETAGILNFKALAARGAREIIDTKVPDLFSAWLDKLKLEGFGFKSTRFEITQNPDGSELEQCVTGCIPYVCEESANYCKKLEADAVQAEFEDRQRNDPNDWSPLRRQYEAFKSAKGLVSGPQEQIPEALVRMTLAKELGIREDDVTPWQINMAVARLLRYYPAITLVPMSAPAKPEAIEPETESVGRQLSRLREECRLTTEELAELIDVDTRSVQRHLAGDSIPYDRHLRRYEREFSKL
jgi:hypothetical protein